MPETNFVITMFGHNPQNYLIPDYILKHQASASECKITWQLLHFIHALRRK